MPTDSTIAAMPGKVNVAPNSAMIASVKRLWKTSAKTEIQRLVAQLSDGGMAVLFVSAELEEVLRLSHRIAVMRDREMVTQLRNDQSVDADRIMQSIAAGAGHEGVPS